MSLEDRARGLLRALVKEVEEGGIRKRGQELRERAERARVRIMDEVVSLLAQKRVRTHERRPWERAEIESSTTAKRPFQREPTVPSPPQPSPPQQRTPEVTTQPQPELQVVEPAPLPVEVPAPVPTAEPEKAPNPEPDDAATTELPASYGGTRLVLIARDPEWGHAYWEIENARISHAISIVGGARAVLRLLDGDEGTLLFEGETWAAEGRYNVRFPTPDRAYAVELVLIGTDGRSMTLARSNRVIAPPAASPTAGEPRFVALSAQRAVLARAKDLTSPPRLDLTRPTTPPALVRDATADELAAGARAEAEPAARAEPHGRAGPAPLGASERMWGT